MTRRRFPRLLVLALCAGGVPCSSDAFGYDAPAGAPPVAAPPVPPAPARPAPVDAVPVPTPDQAASAALAALAAKDDAALRALAAKDDPDPWLVADALIGRGDVDAALAFGKAAPRVDVEGLPAYVASVQRVPAASGARDVVLRGNQARAKGDFAGALEMFARVDAEAPPVLRVRALFGQGLALRDLQRHEAGVAAFSAAAEAAARIGWLARQTWALYEAGWTANLRSDYATAASIWRRRLVVEEHRENRLGIARALGDIGLALDSLGEHVPALELYERSRRISEEIGDRPGVARILCNIAILHRENGNPAAAAAAAESALVAMREVGDRGGEAAVLLTLGNIRRQVGDVGGALARYQEALVLGEALGDRRQIAMALGSIGGAHAARREFEQALALYRRALAAREAIGDRGGVAIALANIARVDVELGAHRRALEGYERALAVFEAIGDQRALARTLGAVGSTWLAVGDRDAALEAHTRALAILNKLGLAGEAGAAFVSIGNVHFCFGSLADAMAWFQRALDRGVELGDRELAADALSNLGALYERLGDTTRATQMLERALAATDAEADPARAAATLGNLASIRDTLHDYDAVERLLTRAKALRERAGDVEGASGDLVSLGQLAIKRGDPARAVTLLQSALEGQLGRDRRGAGDVALASLGVAYEGLGEHAKAIDALERALHAARARGEPDTESRALFRLALVRLGAGEPAAAAALAREAVQKLDALFVGLDQTSGAGASEDRRPYFEVGARAAVALGDAEGLAFFLERQRGRVLLETLQARARIESATLPEDLRRLQNEARAGVSGAARTLRAATQDADPARQRSAAVALQAAQDALRDVDARIERDAKRAAAVVAPRADALADVRGRLGPTEALVMFECLAGPSVALVVRADGARIVSLAPGDEVRAAVAALSLDEASIDPAAGLIALRRLVVDPLGLDASVTRVLVSPDDALSYVPFAALLPDREVVYEPSGTTYGLLLADAPLRGENVLALGDPAYPSGGTSVDGALLRGGVDLKRLPWTAEEARAVGDVVLLGSDASEAGFSKAVAKQARWRSVHFACHGLVDPERPMLSSLALTPDADNDGFLAALDVFRSKVPADLVVLSACETGKGRVYKAEGIVGLTRAFMFAGAPRVLVSLWQVPDEATKALMVEFYRRWNPKDGTAGVAAATALRTAQAHVRSQPRWAHPKFWAAWVLWGVGA